MNRLFKHISQEVGSVRDALNEFKAEVYHRFDLIDQRFDAIERRFDAVEARLDENDLIQNEILNAIGQDNNTRDRRITKFEKHFA